MRIKEILTNSAHRPYPLPTGAWRYYQEWNKALFLHWELDADLLRKYVPEQFTLELFEGKAYVSLVAFTMERIRPAYLPAISALSNFHEINIRTYVKHGNISGVYFLSIEAEKLISCKLAKVLSGLPYRHSEIQRGASTYNNLNTLQGTSFFVDYCLDNKITSVSPLENFLTERYALFQVEKQILSRYDIHHIAWPLYNCSVKSLSIHYPNLQTLFPAQPVLVRYSPGVQVLAWKKQTL